MGPSDLLKPVIERNFSGTIHFGRVAIKPGKPTTFATIPFKSENAEETVSKPVFALPGNPASALVTFYVFVLPALRKLSGYVQSSLHLPRVRVQVQTPMRPDPRVEFHRAIVKVRTNGEQLEGGSGMVLEAWSTGGQRSSRAASLQGANALVIVPSSKDREKGYEKGEWAEAILIGELEVSV